LRSDATLSLALLSARCAIDNVVVPPTVAPHRYLDNNQLTGAIPDSLGALSSLQQLCAPVRWLCARAHARPTACQLAAAMMLEHPVRRMPARGAISDIVHVLLPALR
jgi:hypothetical protein